MQVSKATNSTLAHVFIASSDYAFLHWIEKGGWGVSYGEVAFDCSLTCFAEIGVGYYSIIVIGNLVKEDARSYMQVRIR